MLELKDSNDLQAEKVDTALNIADLFTKCHEWHTMKKLLSLIGLDKELNLELRGAWVLIVLFVVVLRVLQYILSFAFV